MKIIRFIILCIGIGALIGCTHSHRHLKISSYQVSNEVVLSPLLPVNAIQIITTRSPLFYSHAAVRLIYKGQSMFWDPSGSYGDDIERPDYYEENPVPENFYRSQDLITQGDPDLPLYWRYSIFTGDNGMEVFEWTLTEKQAQYYYKLLLKGARQRDNKEGFITKESVKICSAAVSSFLQRFGGDIIPLQEHFILPHGLAHALHELHPNRIYYFEVDRPITIMGNAQLSKQNHLHGN